MIELQHASVHYGQALALKNITLRAAQDEIVAIVGRNGAAPSNRSAATASRWCPTRAASFPI
jgi:ABC-type Mn2+/Zn2+ transport system ATPase subunit